MKIKLCGFNEEKSLKAAISTEIDFIGFVFYEKSPRNITFSQAETLAKLVPDHISKVSVTVNASIEELKLIEKTLKPQYFQLHGDESIENIKQIRQNLPEIKIIKAFSIKNRQDLEKSQKFTDLVDFFLFDGIIAGSGQVFDWDILKNFTPEKNWFLSGGLNQSNILKAIETTNATMIDVSSGIEIEKGIKSPQLIAEFVKKIRDNAH